MICYKFLYSMCRWFIQIFFQVLEFINLKLNTQRKCVKIIPLCFCTACDLVTRERLERGIIVSDLVADKGVHYILTMVLFLLIRLIAAPAKAIACFGLLPELWKQRICCFDPIVCNADDRRQFIRGYLGACISHYLCERVHQFDHRLFQHLRIFTCLTVVQL